MLSSRLVLVLAAALLAVPASFAEPLSVAPVGEFAVEGHTVYAVIESTFREGSTAAVPPPYAKGPLARSLGLPPLPQPSGAPTTNAVRWMNDQDLVPSGGPRGAAIAVLVRENVVLPGVAASRSPCTGAVIAVDAGSTNPRDFADGWLPMSYHESYFVRDPNQNEWVIDKWVGESWGSPLPIFVVALLGASASSPVPDDGASDCAPFVDGARAHEPEGRAYPDGRGGSLQYNALLYLPIDRLSVAGTSKDHRPGSPHLASDVAACSLASACPDDDDDREGNSHPYAPYQPLFPSRPEARRAPRESVCPGPLDGCHETRMLDLYYGTWPEPAMRVFTLVDSEGWDSRV